MPTKRHHVACIASIDAEEMPSVRLVQVPRGPDEKHNSDEAGPGKYPAGGRGLAPRDRLAHRSGVVTGSTRVLGVCHIPRVIE